MYEHTYANLCKRLENVPISFLIFLDFFMDTVLSVECFLFFFKTRKDVANMLKIPVITL